MKKTGAAESKRAFYAASSFSAQRISVCNPQDFSLSRYNAGMMTPHARRLLFCVLLACIPQFAVASDWLTLSGASYHFQQDRRDWRQFNPGIGWERDATYPDLTWSAGYFQNSYNKPCFYAGGRWMPLEVGPVKIGLFGLAATGYPSPVLVLPALNWDIGKVGLNVVAVPNLPGYSGYVGAQLRVKLD